MGLSSALLLMNMSLFVSYWGFSCCTAVPLAAVLFDGILMRYFKRIKHFFVQLVDTGNNLRGEPDKEHHIANFDIL